ncbi:hypothetical protein UFOVP74_33 [uncultured Caudovirales phage]|uniref:Uncharacterized protein n=1 Tax=uncultured Caudovirales phage TaxID=2100421 RepID=A0A6J5L379_9CAUD|nr:hypothetical protein UFOVP74_33 [uncultured Caudovirales phage]
MKETLTNMVARVWDYFRSMNSEPGTDHVSNKRNMAWGIATLLVFVEAYSLMHLPYKLDTEINHYVYLCIVYALIDALFVLLVLGVTSLEKVQSLVQALKGNKVDEETKALKGGEVVKESLTTEEEKID